MYRLRDYLTNEVFAGKPNISILKLIKVIILGTGSQRAILMYRLAKWLYDSNHRRLSKFMFSRLETNYGTFISPNSKIGMGLKLPHPNGIVIGNRCVIGNNVTIFQQVTLGGRIIGDSKRSFYPEIGDHTVLFAGAKLIGKIKIGKSCIIGANSVVLIDMPDYSTAVGVPAKISRMNSRQNA